MSYRLQDLQTVQNGGDFIELGNFILFIKLSFQALRLALNETLGL